MFSGITVGQQYYGLDHNLNPIGNNNDPSYFISFENSETGLYSVKIYYASMNLLMTGNSIDSLGQRLDGNCRFYYDNGDIQSEGAYSNGRKSGVWKRYNTDGSRKMDRIYSDVSMETVIFNSALIMPKPLCDANGFEEFVKNAVIKEGIIAIIELSPIAIQLVIDRNGKVTERRFDDRLSLQSMNTLDQIIKQIPSWEAGSTGTQKINVRVNYKIDFSTDQ